MKFPRIKVHIEALAEVIEVKILEADPTEVASDIFDIWQDWREEVHEDLPSKKSDQMNMYLADCRWKILTGFAHLGYQILGFLGKLNKLLNNQ